MINLVFVAMGFFVGIVFHSLIPFVHYIFYAIKYSLISVKVNEMYATYSYKLVEPWLEENYNQLYEVTHVGKRYVKLNLVDRKSGYNSQELIVTKEDLSNNYKPYQGKKSIKNKLRQGLKRT